MENTNSRKFNNALKAYLLEAIEAKAEDYAVDLKGINPFAWVVGIAKDEVPHEFQRCGDQEFRRYGDQGGLTAWLSGLALPIAYTYSDIIAVSEKLHECKLTEKEENLVCENWFSFIAVKILQYSRK